MVKKATSAHKGKTKAKKQTKSSRKERKVDVINIAFIAILLFTGFYLFFPTAKATADFSTCIEDTGARMYGSKYCANCHKQKRMLTSPQSLEIDCTEDRALCREKGIRAYPTWIFQGDEGEQKVVGKLSLEELSYYTECPL